jgi:hypothetical protein
VYLAKYWYDLCLARKSQFELQNSWLFLKAILVAWFFFCFESKATFDFYSFFKKFRVCQKNSEKQNKVKKPNRQLMLRFVV